MTGENTQALFIDVQERLVSHMYNAQAVTGRIITLLDGLQALSIPGVVTEQYPRGLGPTSAKFIEHWKGSFSPWAKSAFNCLSVPEVEQSLSRNKANHIVVCGVETHICVMQTALALLHADYTPIVVVDAVSSRNELDHQTALRRLEREGAIVATVESILMEITAGSTHPAFNTISALIK